MLPTLRRWLHRMVCPHKTWLPCPESPGSPSQIECPCCGKLKTIEHPYRHADSPPTTFWLNEEYAADVERVRRGEISINALRAEQNRTPAPPPRFWSHEDK